MLLLEIHLGYNEVKEIKDSVLTFMKKMFMKKIIFRDILIKKKIHEIILGKYIVYTIITGPKECYSFK